MNSLAARKVLFFCSATVDLGVGHVMRCLEYARSLKRLGFTVEFLGSVTVAWLEDVLKDAEIPIRDRADTHYSLLILDSYNQRDLIHAVNQISYDFVIQVADSNTPLLPDVFLVWLDTQSPMMQSIEPGKLLLQGLAAFPVKKFPSRKLPSPVAKNVLVALGGFPKSNHVELILGKISIPEFSRIKFHFFANNSDRSYQYSNVQFYPLGRKLEVVAKECDTVISGAGTSIWDFLVNKLPVGAVCLVNNQEENYRYVVERSMVVGLGRIYRGESVELLDLRNLLFNSSWRNTIISNSPEELDGNGVFRFTNKVLDLLR